MRRLVLPILLLALPVTLACQEGPDCTADNRPSVTLTVVDDESSEAVPDPIISFRVDGGELRMPESFSPRIVLAYEEAGLFEVTVEADGYAPASAEYQVTSDECHVVTVTETIELTPLSP